MKLATRMHILPILVFILAFTVCGAMAQAQQPAPVEIERSGFYTTAPTQYAPQITSRGEINLDNAMIVPHRGRAWFLLLDATTGDIIDPEFIRIESGGITTHAIWNFSQDGFFASVQTGDFGNVVYEYSLEGEFKGVFAPSGGVDPDIMQDIRGIMVDPSGTRLWVTVAGGPNRGAIAEFDMEGNYVGNFIEPQDSPMNEPTAILIREDDILISSASPSGIYRFTLDGEYIEQWSEGEINFPLQIFENPDGNVLTTALSDPSGLYEFTEEGEFVGFYDVLYRPRGVYELPNGNILLTSGGGIHEVNRDNELVRDIVSFSAEYIQPLTPRGGLSIVPRNLNIEMAAGTTETVTFSMTNTTADPIEFAIPTWPDIVSSVSPTTGTVAAESTIEVTVTFDATEELGGLFQGTISIETDEDANNIYPYRVSALIIGDSECVVEPDPIAFDPVIVGYDITVGASITNIGFGPCTLSDTSADIDDFTVHFDGPVTLQPEESFNFSVTFAPQSVGTISGTLTIESDKGNVTAGLTGTGIAPPVAGINPPDITVQLPPDNVTTQTLTLSNLGVEGAADLEYSISLAAASPAMQRSVHMIDSSRRPYAVPVIGAIDFISENDFTGSNGLPSVGYAQRGDIDCDAQPGIIIQDDGSVESGYGGNPNAVDMVNMVDLFTPVGYPATFTHICVTFFAQAGAPSSMPFEIVAFANDGPEGAPGTLLGSVTATAIDIPPVAGMPLPIHWQTVDISEMGLFIEEGSIFLGVRYAPPPVPTVFMAADQSTDRPVGYAGGYWGGETEGEPTEWQALGFDTFPNYRALMIRPVGTIVITSVTVEPNAGAIAAGSAQDLLVTIDSDGLEKGIYDYQIMIHSNDPENPVLVVEVTITVEGVSGEPDGVPGTFALEQNYPNPFMGTTTIEFALAEAGPVMIEVFDLTGRHIATLVDGEMPAGYHSTTWNTSDVASGVYLYRIRSGTFSQTRRALVIR